MRHKPIPSYLAVVVVTVIIVLAALSLTQIAGTFFGVGTLTNFWNRIIGKQSGLNVIMMWEYREQDGTLIATGNSRTGSGPLAIVWQSGGPGGDIEVKPGRWWLFAPIPEVTVSDLEGTNAEIRVTATLSSITYGGASILSSTTSTFPNSRTYTFTVGELKTTPKRTLDGLDGRKITADVILSSPPAVGSTKTVQISYNIKAELYIDGVKVSEDTKSVATTMTIKNTVSGTIVISSINFNPIFFVG